MDKNNSEQKWHFKVSTNLHRASPEQIWPLFKDFFGIHKWFPGLATSHGIEGSNGESGCVRLCSGFGLKNETSKSNVSWSKERLIVIDDEEMTFTYEMVDSSLGFKSYISTVKVVATELAVIEWCISLDPIVGWRREDLVVKYEIGLKGMLEKMEASTPSVPEKSA